MGTRPENLALDPMFGSLGTQYAQTVILQDAKAYLVSLISPDDAIAFDIARSASTAGGSHAVRLLATLPLSADSGCRTPCRGRRGASWRAGACSGDTACPRCRR